MKLLRKPTTKTDSRTGNDAFSLKNRLYPVAVLLSLFLLYGCGKTSNQPSSGSGSIAANGEFSSSLPQQLQKHRAGLSAEVHINKDDGTVSRTEPLFIDPETHQLSGKVSGLPLGAYTFTIHYTLGGALVAIQITASVVSDNDSTPIAFDALTFPDDDNDGFINLAEIESGFDPTSADSRPLVEIPRFSANYVITDVTVSSPSERGTSSSVNYSVNSGL